MGNKNLYENVIIMKGTLSEEEYKKSLDKIIKNIKNLVEIKEIEELGQKKLAYEVKNQKSGYYVVFNIIAEHQAIIEMERIYRITDEIIKFLTVKKED